MNILMKDERRKKRKKEKSDFKSCPSRAKNEKYGLNGKKVLKRHHLISNFYYNFTFSS